MRESRWVPPALFRGQRPISRSVRDLRRGISPMNESTSTVVKRGRAGRHALAATVVAVIAGGGIAAVGVANADTTPTPSNPYIVAPPGASLDSGDATTIQVAGRTFSGTAVPSNATGAVVKITSVNPSHSG